MSTPLNEEALVNAIMWKDLPKGGAGEYIRLDANAAHAVIRLLKPHLSAVPADTVNSVAELDALPDDSVVLDDAGTVLRKWTEDTWYATSDVYDYLSRSIGLPATVLYHPAVDGA